MRLNDSYSILSIGVKLSFIALWKLITNSSRRKKHARVYLRPGGVFEKNFIPCVSVHVVCISCTTVGFFFTHWQSFPWSSRWHCWQAACLTAVASTPFNSIDPSSAHNLRELSRMHSRLTSSIMVQGHLWESKRKENKPFSQRFTQFSSFNHSRESLSTVDT